jgi:hypothetical protein
MNEGKLINAHNISLDYLKPLIADGAPVYYIRQDHVFTSSIFSILATRNNTYITLDDGTMLNTENFGNVAFWSESEAVKLLAQKEEA